MLIKQNGFNLRLNKTLPSVFLLIGQEPLQLDNLAVLIKKTWSQQSGADVEQSIIHIHNASDWQRVAEEANSYSLFSNTVLLDVRFDKKTLDASGKAMLEHYLKSPNSRCLILIRAPDLPVKQVSNLASHDSVHVMSIGTPSPTEIRQWISSRLNAMGAQVDPGIPALIQQYNEGNLLACSQLLDKLAILIEPGTALTAETVKEQLINQCEYSLYELADACLTGDSVKTLLLLRQAAANKTEATLVLWLLTQETRLLMQLQPFAGQPGTLRDKATQLKIWSSRQGLYLKAAGRCQPATLTNLLRLCNKLDSDIKTGHNRQVWNNFELIALTLCSGKQIGCPA
ncbi:DNA polymerase III subunit delta [Legionella sp. CNM-4043-24]|uniref:DNA polymerase III subunit delta n=1 Tax=Legionella sp. CNM-4043-24 TaxID=3421646 RepID=UPI00403AD9BD